MSGWAIGISATALAVSAAGTGYSMYAGERGASAARGANAANERIRIAEAKATAAVQRFQAQLNYKSAMAQAQVYGNNAVVLRDQARTTERQGFEAVKRMLIKSDGEQSAIRAAYGASGVSSDTGSPLVVEAYNAGMQQLARMDMAYKTNIDAGALDWDAKMQTYQQELTKETAKQYLYAEEMANYTERTGIMAANAQTMAGNAMAQAQLMQTYGNATSNFAGALSGFSSTLASVRQPKTATTAAPVTNVQTMQSRS